MVSSLRWLIAVLTAMVLLAVFGCGGGGGGAGEGGTNLGSINVSEYLPLNTGNSWRVRDNDSNYFVRCISKTVVLGNVNVPAITEYISNESSETGQEFYWTSDANGWTIYGHRYSADGVIIREEPPIRVPNGLADGATGTTGSNVTYTVKQLGSYSLYYTGETFSDTIKVTFRYGSDSEYFILARGVGVIYDGFYSLSSWTIR